MASTEPGNDDETLPGPPPDPGGPRGPRSGDADVRGARGRPHPAPVAVPVPAEIMAAVPVGVGVCTLKGRILFANRRLARLLGFPRAEDAVGASLERFHRVPALARDLILERLRDGCARGVELDLVRLDGTDLPASIQARVRRLPSHADPVVVFTLEDVGVERERRESSAQGHKLEAIVRFAGGVAHDYNNLLAAIVGEAQELLLEAPADTVREGIRRILEAARRASEITERLTTFSRSQTAHPEVLDVNTLVSDLAASLRTLAGPEIDLVLRLEPGVGHARIDGAHLRDLLVRLVENARDAMPAGGRIVVETSVVDAPGDTEGLDFHPPVPPGLYVSIAVGDTGIGMNADTRQRVFDPFFTTKSLGRGAGLGLTTVYGHLLRAHGHVSLMSAPAHGTLVRALLPRVAEAEAEARSSPSAELVPPAARPTLHAETPGRILVVDDEEGVRRVLSRVLSRAGHEVVSVPDAVTARRLVVMETEAFDLVVTDVMMPGSDGTELARWLRDRDPDLPVLFVSGYADAPRVREWLEEDPDALLHKPFDVDTLLSRVRQKLAAARPRPLPALKISSPGTDTPGRQRADTTEVTSHGPRHG